MITSIWANDGGDKVTQDELRGNSTNKVWDGTSVNIFGAKNEVVSFCLILEASDHDATDVSISLNELVGPGGYRLRGTPSRDNLFQWKTREIELFYVRYLQIKGLSRLSYETYDERHIPARFQRPGGTGTWFDRPDHDKFYPDIAVPIELHPTFTIKAGQNQSIWVDIYIPGNAKPGQYTGELIIQDRRVPVNLKVRNFTLSHVPASKTMVYAGYETISERYTGIEYPDPGTPEYLLARRVMHNQMLVAHRHKISLINTSRAGNQPDPEWKDWLSGAAFTVTRGYKGPGMYKGNNIYSIGTYGAWQWWWKETELLQNATEWENWFKANTSGVERFLYLIDESKDYAQTERWAQAIKASGLKSFATANLLEAKAHVPSLDIIASWFGVADTNSWEQASKQCRFFCYNGVRPASGSFAIEDDGIALRELPWGQFKKSIKRWFFWEATYYKDFQGGRGHNNVFQNAHTFGGDPHFDNVRGMTGWNYSNGDGLLFYPGTDKIFPEESYGIEGPIVSLRLKHWRRGIQDVDYLTQARRKNRAATDAIINRMVPKVLWENGVDDPNDPTWVRCPISWSTNPDDWENAREELANIIEGQVS